METTTKITLAEIIELLDRSYELVYTDYRDNLDEQGEILDKAIEAKSRQPIYEQYSESEWDAESYGMKYALEELNKEMCRAFDIEEDEADELIEENRDEIEDEIYNRDESDLVGDLLKNTDPVPVMVSMYSNYDCINSHWLESSDGYSYQDSYFGHVVDVLRLNPAEVKKMLVSKGEKVFGSWPNKPKRKPLVTLEQFREEDVNRGCGGCLLVFVGLLDVGKMQECFTKVTFPKGNTCGFFSSCQGGGSMIGMELLEDFTINLNGKHHSTSADTWGITTANNGSYSIKDVYGVCNSFFGNEIRTFS